MKKIPDTSKFIVTQDFNRLIKIIFNVRWQKYRKALKIKKKQRMHLIQNIKIENKIKKFKMFDVS